MACLFVCSTIRVAHPCQSVTNYLFLFLLLFFRTIALVFVRCAFWNLLTESFASHSLFPHVTSHACFTFDAEERGVSPHCCIPRSDQQLFKTWLQMMAKARPKRRTISSPRQTAVELVQTFSKFAYRQHGKKWDTYSEDWSFLTNARRRRGLIKLQPSLSAWWWTHTARGSHSLPCWPAIHYHHCPTAGTCMQQWYSHKHTHNNIRFSSICQRLGEL